MNKNFRAGFENVENESNESYDRVRDASGLGATLGLLAGGYTQRKKGLGRVFLGAGSGTLIGGGLGGLTGLTIEGLRSRQRKHKEKMKKYRS